MGHWIVDTAGVGSIIVFSVFFAILAAYIFTLRWIQNAPPDHPVPATTAEQPQGNDAPGTAVGGEEA